MHKIRSYFDLKSTSFSNIKDALDINYFKKMNSMFSKAEIMNNRMTKQNQFFPDLEIIFKEILDSQMPDGSLTYSNDLNTVFSDLILDFTNQPLENISYYEDRFDFMDTKLIEYHQRTQQKKTNDEEEKQEAEENPEDDSFDFILSNNVLLTFFEKSDHLNTDFLICLLEHIQSNFAHISKFKTLKYSKKSILSMNKLLHIILSNQKYNTKEISGYIQSISFSLIKALKSIFPLSAHIRSIIEFHNEMDFQNNNFSEYFPLMNYKSNKLFTKKVKFNSGIINKMSFFKAYSVSIFTESNKVYILNLETGNINELETSIPNELSAISSAYTFQYEPSKKQYYIQQISDPKTKNYFKLDKISKPLFLLSYNDIFYAFGEHINEGENEDSNFCYYKINPEESSEASFQNNFVLLKLDKAPINAAINSAERLLLSFENSPFDFNYFNETEYTETFSLFCKNHICAINADYSVLLNEESNELIVLDRNNSSDLFLYQEFLQKYNNEFKSSDSNYNISLSNNLKIRLLRVLSESFDDEILNANRFYSYFSKFSDLIINDFLDICEILTKTKEFPEFLDISLLIVIICIIHLKKNLSSDLKNRILNFYFAILTDNISIEFPQYQTYIILSLSLSFHDLFPDDSNNILKYFELITSNEIRYKAFLDSRCLYSICQTPAIFYFSGILSKYHKTTIFQLLEDQLPISKITELFDKLINNFFQETSYNQSIKYLSKFLKIFTFYIVSFSYDNSKETNSFFTILFKIALLLIPLSIPLKSSGSKSILPFIFAEVVAPFLPKINAKFDKNPQFLESEEKYVNEIKPNYSTKVKQHIFETIHSSSEKQLYFESFIFPGATELTLTLNKKSQFSAQADFVISYKKFDGTETSLKIQKPSDIPPGMKIESDNIKIECCIPRYPYMWGISLTIEGVCLKENEKFKPYFPQFLLVYFTHLIGKFIGNGFNNLYTYKIEEDCKILLESNILQQISKQNNDYSHSDQENIENKIKRTISRGLSFNIEPSNTTYDSEMLKMFLKDITSENTKENGFAHRLFSFMAKKVPSKITNTKIIPEIVSVEKNATAVLMKHLGLTNESLSYAMIIGSDPSIPVPPNLNKIWKAVYRIRFKLYSIYQKFKTQNNIKAFNETIEEYKNKCTFLLEKEPVLRILINNISGKLDNKQTIEVAIDELLKFIMSSVKLTELMNIIKCQQKKYNTRIRSLQLIKFLINSNDLKTISKTSILRAVLPGLNDALLSNDIQSIPDDMINQFNNLIEELFSHFINNFIDKNNPKIMRLISARILSLPFENFFNIEKIYSSLTSLINFLIQDDTIYLEQLVVLFIAKLSFSDSIDSMESATKISSLFDILIFSNLYEKQNITSLLLNILALIEQRSSCPYDKIDQIIQILFRQKQLFPKTASNIFSFLGQYFAYNGIIENFPNNPMNITNFEQFITFVLKEIGNTYLNGQNAFLDLDDLNGKGSYFYIVSQMITFIRILSSSFSKVSYIITNILHTNLKQIKTKSPESIGVLLVLGFGIHSLKYCPTAILASKKSQTKNIQIEYYSEHLSTFIGYILGKKYKMTFDLKPIAQPNFNFLTNNFVLDDDECEIISDILLNICEKSLIDNTIFTAIFTSFLFIVIQNHENILNIQKYISLQSLFPLIRNSLNLLSKFQDFDNNYNSIYNSFNQLSDEILDLYSSKYKSPNTLYSLNGNNVTGLTTNDNNDYYSFGGNAYEIEVMKLGNHFSFGFISENSDYYTISPTLQEYSFKDKSFCFKNFSGNINIGDKFICFADKTLLNSNSSSEISNDCFYIYFNCKSKSYAYYLKSENQKIIPIIYSEGYVLNVKPLDALTLKNNEMFFTKRLIDLTLAKTSHKKHKPLKMERNNKEDETEDKSELRDDFLGQFLFLNDSNSSNDIDSTSPNISSNNANPLLNDSEEFVDQQNDSNDRANNETTQETNNSPVINLHNISLFRNSQRRSTASIQKRKIKKALKKKLKKKKNISKPNQFIFLGSKVIIDLNYLLQNEKLYNDPNNQDPFLFRYVSTSDFSIYNSLYNYDKIGTVIYQKVNDNTEQVYGIEFFDFSLGKKIIIECSSQAIKLISNSNFFVKESKSKQIFSLKMLRYTTLVIFDSILSNFTNLSHSLLNIDNINEPVIPEFILSFITELISINHNISNIKDYSQKSFNQNTLISHNSIIVPGNRKFLKKTLFNFINSIISIDKDFFPNLFQKIIDKWPSLSFEDYSMLAPNELRLNCDGVKKWSAVDTTYGNKDNTRDHQEIFGFILLVSPDSDLTNNSLTIYGKSMKIVIQSYENGKYNGFTNEKAIRIVFTPIKSSKDKIHFAAIPVFKYPTIRNIHSSLLNYYHTLTVLLNISFSFFAYQNDSRNISISLSKFFAENLIPFIIYQLTQKNTFAQIVYYNVLLKLLNNAYFQYHPLPNYLVDNFNVVIESYIQFEKNKLSLTMQKLIMVKILLKIASNSIPCFPNSDGSILISKDSLKEAIKRIKINQFFSDSQKLENCQNENPKIAQCIHDFELCYSLSNPIIFPYYILINQWTSFKQINNTYNGDGKDFKCIVFEPFSSSLIVSLNNQESEIPNDAQINIIHPLEQKELLTIPHIGYASIPLNYFIISSKYSTSFPLSIHVKSNLLNSQGKSEIFRLNINKFRNDLLFLEKNWKRDYDDCLMQICHSKGSIIKELPENAYALYPKLHEINERLIQIRLFLISKLSSSIQDIFKKIQLNNVDSPITHLLSKVSSCISFHDKEEYIWNCLEDGNNSFIDSYNFGLGEPSLTNSSRHRISITFNRSKSALFMNNPLHPQASSLLMQLKSQVAIKQLASLCNPNGVPWHVDLEGEGASDAGGPGRELFSQICAEIMDKRSGLFCQTPNQRKQSNLNQDELIPNSKIIARNGLFTLNSSNSITKIESTRNDENKILFENFYDIQIYVYVGALIAISYISKLPQPFAFPNFVWSYLVGRKIVIQDIYEIDEEFKQAMISIRNCPPTAPFESLYNLNFSIDNSAGETVELISGGSLIKVNYENRLQYCQLCEEYRIHEFDPILEKIKEGLNMLIHSTLLNLLSPWELKLLCCGNPDIPLDELRANCKFFGSYEFENMLFKVLGRFNSQERMLFIKFATGRMSLPASGMTWTSKLIIKFVDKGTQQDQMLPTATTCSNTIHIPQYSNEAILEKMLRIAILYGSDIDQDNEPNFNEIAPLD